MSRESVLRDFIDRPPGHARVLGPPGSGKTTLLVERYHALVARGLRPGVIAFGREQREALLDRLVPDGAAILGPLPVTTHGHLASGILDRARPGRPRTLRDVDELIVLDRVLEREDARMESDLRSIQHSRSFRDDAIDLLHVLAQNGVSAEAAAHVRECTTNRRARDLLGLYTAYRRALDERGLVTFYDAAGAAAACVAHDPASAPARYDTLLIDDFQDLDRGQFELIRALAPPGGNTAVEVFGDPTGARFSFRGTSDRFLNDIFPATYRTRELALAPARAGASALLAATTELILTTASTPGGAAAVADARERDLPLFATVAADTGGEGRAWKVGVTATAVVDEIAEAQQAALLARTWAHKVDPSEIAVIAMDADRYRSLLLLAFEERGVVVDVGGPSANATDELIRAVVGVLGRDPDGRFAESLASSPLLPALEQSFPRGERPADVVAWVREVAGARGDGFEKFLRDHVMPIAGGAGPSASASAERAIDEWQRYRSVTTLIRASTSFDEFRAAYLDTPAPRAHRAAAVSVLSPREAVGRSFARTIVVGCVDGVVAGKIAREGYLPVGALARAFEGTDEETSRQLARRVDRDESLRLADALLLTALTRARDRLAVFAPRKLAGETTAPAIALQPLFSDGDEAAPRSVAPALAAARVVADSSRSEAAAARVRSFDRATAWRLTPEAPVRLPVMETFSLSPSGMETFSDCQRRFFYEKVLRLDDATSIYMTVGTVFHEVMHRTVAPGMGRDEVIAAVTSPEVATVIDEEVEEAMRDAGPWLRDLTRAYLSNMIERVAALEREREGEYRVESVERDGRMDEAGVLIKGRLDRIDRVDGIGAVVIDYKSSQSSVKKTASIQRERIEAEGGRGNWQVPLYAAMAAAAGIPPSSFVYYVVPPGEEAFATGLQLEPGRLKPPIPLGRKGAYRYESISPDSIRAALVEAFDVHAAVAEGRHEFQRTEDRESCRRCRFAIVCRRANE